MTLFRLALLFGFAATTLAMSVCTSEPGLLRVQVIGNDGRAYVLKVEVADTQAKLTKGLSGRDSLPDDRGMLFVIEQRGPGFWMKDMQFSLSLAFISKCGEIVDVQDMERLSLEFHDTGQEFRFGLEVNEGWFRARGVGVGGRLVLPPTLIAAGCPGS